MAELEAIKPGNVHVFADGHGMVVQDFITSARVASVEIAVTHNSVGQRILNAVSATIKAVGCNTNLGIILLSAPMIHASISKIPLTQVLQELSVDDAELSFQAITLASPAGLGEVAEHDVHTKPTVTLLQAMQSASGFDRIAHQYATAYEDVLGFGLARFEAALSRWDNLSWAVTATYLGFLAEFPDTHVMRKHGLKIAQDLQQQAMKHEQAYMVQENPKKYLGELLRFDTKLKQNGFNPGTSADLTVATLLARLLDMGKVQSK